jgi:O-Antigen ligase
MMKSNTISKDIFKKREFLFLILILSAYTFISSLSFFFKIDSINFSVPFRFLIFIFSLFLIFNTSIFNQINKKLFYSFVFFWLLYLVKAIYSFNKHQYNKEFLDQEYEIYMRIIINCFTPCLALLVLNYQKMDSYKVLKITYVVFTIMLSVNAIHEMLVNRLGVTNGIFAMYYISSGHLGTTLCVFSLYYLLFTNASQQKNTLYLITLLLGLFTIYISGARSPLLALVIVFFYFVVLKREIKYFLYFFTIITLMVFIIYWIGKENSLESDFVKRTYTWIFEGNTSGRGYYFYRGIDTFLCSPFLGGRILYEDGMYPHNIFVEVLMSVGLVGAIAFFVLFLDVIKSVKKIIIIRQGNQSFTLFFALWLQYFILVQTSYSINSNVEFWYLSAIIIALCNNDKYEKTKSSHSSWNPSRNH